MNFRRAFAQSLKSLRQARHVTQEDFDQVSSRTYVSMLERGERSPTLEKINQLASVLKVHPLTLMALSYMNLDRKTDPKYLLERVSAELSAIAAPIKKRG